MSDNTKRLNDVAELVIELALREPGVTGVGISGSISVGFSASVRMQEVENIEFHHEQSLGITIYKDHVTGSATTSSLLLEDLQSSIKAACNIANYAQADPYAELPPSILLASNIPDLQLYHPCELTPEVAMQYALECEIAALDFDAKITNSDGASLSMNTDYTLLASSQGFCAVTPSTRYSASVRVIADNGVDVMQQDSEYTVAREFKALMSMAQVGQSAAAKALAQLGATNIATTAAAVLFTPRMARRLIGALISSISGGSLYRQASFCNNRLHTKILPDFINIVERPLILKALGSSAFDDDGLATYDKDLVREGVLATYLLSYYSAKRLGMKSTSNAGGAHNVIVEPGDADFAGLVKAMHRGLVVTSMMGHGTNIVTGDFSHGVSGFWVENGVIVQPVHEITIAGNLLEMFSRISAVGNDLDYTGGIITGSILVEEMTIAGG